ncbi:molybdenum ABC transporter ATP-binding protein [Halofilum ochraceum]|uniref:molybdenum ABC transporter ATP-binding protein n=1 Tax=Halofilum ochraceum TaxID=1611323 RepID=UPI0008D92D28|nr:molybdenum ABC transporter ATP-binding protein [Halofilum ochraceum]
MTRLAVDIRRDFPDFRLAIAHDFELRGITALFGPSGGGKTTLLRAIAGHERRAAGRIAHDGEVWQEGRHWTPPHRRGVGYVAQNPQLFPHLSVAGNLRYAARRAPAGADGTGFDEVVEQLDLQPLLARRPDVLSGGERQRVALGRALLTRPRLLLMDEPLAGLDIQRKTRLLPYIARLPAAFGIPIIYVTHAVDEVIRLGDRMVALREGGVFAAGGVTELLERLDLAAATGRFEAGTVLSGEVVSHDEPFQMTRVSLGEQVLDMPRAPMAVGTEVRLRVRARDVALATVRPTGISIRNILNGRISEIVEEPDTAFAEVLVDLGDQRLRARLTRAAVADLGLEEGGAVWALIKAVAFDRRVLGAGSTGAETETETETET